MSILDKRMKLLRTIPIGLIEVFRVITCIYEETNSENSSFS